MPLGAISPQNSFLLADVEVLNYITLCVRVTAGERRGRPRPARAAIGGCVRVGIRARVTAGERPVALGNKGARDVCNAAAHASSVAASRPWANDRMALRGSP